MEVPFKTFRIQPRVQRYQVGDAVFRLTDITAIVFNCEKRPRSIVRSAAETKGKDK